MRIWISRQRCCGLTLLELLVSLAIISLTLALALPALASIQLHLEADQESRLLQRAISSARQLAVQEKHPVLLCPLDASNICQADWNLPLGLFIDRDRNLQYSPDEERIVLTIAATDNQSLRNYPRKAIRFDPNGFAGGYNGSLSYCRQTGAELKRGSAVIISRTGRLRYGVDSDGDGLPETASGKNIACPD